MNTKSQGQTLSEFPTKGLDRVMVSEVLILAKMITYSLDTKL